MNSPKKGTFGRLTLDSINEKLKPGAPAHELGNLDELVQHSTRLKRSTYLHLKQAKHWVPGFIEQDFIEAAILAALELLPDAKKPLPPLVLQELIRRNKKLQG